MYELKHNLILPDLRAALPYTPSQELIFIAGGRHPRLPPRSPRQSPLSAHPYMLATKNRGCARCGT